MTFTTPPSIAAIQKSLPLSVLRTFDDRFSNWTVPAVSTEDVFEVIQGEFTEAKLEAIREENAALDQELADLRTWFRGESYVSDEEFSQLVQPVAAPI
jgi:hypothetical protein